MHISMSFAIASFLDTEFQEACLLLFSTIFSNSPWVLGRTLCKPPDNSFGGTMEVRLARHTYPSYGKTWLRAIWLHCGHYWCNYLSCRNRRHVGLFISPGVINSWSGRENVDYELRTSQNLTNGALQFRPTLSEVKTEYGQYKRLGVEGRFRWSLEIVRASVATRRNGNDYIFLEHHDND